MNTSLILESEPLIRCPFLRLQVSMHYGPAEKWLPVRKRTLQRTQVTDTPRHVTLLTSASTATWKLQKYFGNGLYPPHVSTRTEFLELTFGNTQKEKQ